MNEFLAHKDGEVSPKINPDSFRSYQELSIEMKALLLAHKECSLDCPIILELIQKRIDSLGNYMRYISQPNPTSKAS